MANILVIEDEPVLLGLISSTLRGDGHSVVPMSDPLAAVECFVSERLPVDLLLTDVTLTPIGGFEVMKRMLKQGFGGAALFMSGYSAMSGAIADSLGNRALIEKPFTASELRASVTRALTKNKNKAPWAA